MPDSSDKSKPETRPPSTTDTRRRLLRYLVAGGGVGSSAAFIPATWTSPIVQTVVLPAHAQTSAVPFDGNGLVGESEITRAPEPDGLSFEDFVAKVRSAVISDAEAVPLLPVPSLFCISIFVANLLNNSSSATVTLNSNFFGIDQGSGSLGQLLSSGIPTSLGYLVIASALNEDGTGNGTVNGNVFQLNTGSCEPQDSGGENGKMGGGGP